MMRKLQECVLCSLILLLTSSVCTRAQLNVVIGPTSGSNSYLYGPYYRSSSSSSFDYSRYAYLYSATELNIPAGALITEVAWLKASGTITGNNTFNVWMENTSATSLPSTAWSSLIATSTQVYASTSHSFTAANDSYETVPLSSPFQYTGGALKIVTDHVMTGSASAANDYYYETVTGMGIGWASSAAPSASTVIGSSSYSNKRPTIRITYLLAAGNNAGIPELTSPVNFCSGPNDIKVKVKNMGINIIDSVKVAWTLDGVAQTPYNLTTPLDTIGGLGLNEIEVTLGTYNFTSAPVDLKAWTYLPNGTTDTANANDTLNATLQSSLSGTYTINSALPTGGTNYHNFADFTNALNTYGVCGPVVANVVSGSGPYAETVTFGAITGTSATNTVRVNGNGETVQFDNTSSSRQLLTLDGAQYVTIDSLNFKTLDGTYGWGALITGGSAYDSIMRCTFDLTSITGSSSANCSGIAFSASTTSATSAGTNGSHCYIGYNHIKSRTGSGGAYYCLTVVGTSDSNVIAYNHVENHYYYGIYINDATGTQVLHNEIERSTKTTVTTFYGIYTTGVTPGTRIVGNRIHDPYGGTSSSTSTFYGIMSYGDGTTADPVLIANNAIYNINQGGSVYALYLSTSPYAQIYHNTINIDQNLSSSSTNYGLYFTGTNTGTESKNNNISITAGGTGTKYGFYYSSTSSIDDAQKNNIYVNSTQSGTQYYGRYGSTYTTQAAFQAAYPLLEVGSPSADPQFVNVATGDLTPGNPALISVGENLMTVVPEDISGNPRTGSPTLGAFELPPTGGNNAGTGIFVTPAAVFCSGSQSVSVTITNGGTNNITSAQLHWTVNGVAQPTVNYSGMLVPLSSPTGQSIDTVVLGNATFPQGTPTDITVWVAMPNGIADTSNLNDTITGSFIPSLSGTFTINSALPTGGTNYQSFADFTTDLLAYGVCGPVVANVATGSGPYVETVKFGAISGVSATNTIRVNGNGRTVQFDNTSSDRQLLTLDGAQYIIIDSLNFKTLDGTYGWGALITGGSAYDSIMRCTFDLTSITGSSSANCSGIAFSNSTTSATSTGTNGSHCYIGYNHIKNTTGYGGAYYCLTVVGTSDSNVIAYNHLENHYYYGIYINGATGTHVLHNEIERAAKTTVTTFYGIYTTGVTPGTRLVGNRIHDPYGGTGSSTSTFYGIMSYGDGTTADPVLIANNAIYNINQGGSVYALYLSTAPHVLVYHNTINIDQNLSSSSTNYGMYFSGTNTGTESKNNNISITAGGTGTKYGFYYSSTSSIDDAQKNNIYVNSTQSGTQNYGYYSGAYTTQAAFQAANPLLEVGSPSADPQFANAALGDLTPGNYALLAVGLNLNAIVPLDIIGSTRSPLPTPGAFEFPPSGPDNAGVMNLITPKGNFCPGQQPVSVSIINVGSNNITSLEIHWEANGVPQPVVNYNNTLTPITSGSGQSIDTVVLGNAQFNAGTATGLKIWTALPNNVTDSDHQNDTLESSAAAPVYAIETISDTICINTDAYMSLDPHSGYEANALQWQNSLNGTTWTGIPNTDTVDYMASPSGVVWYRVKINDGLYDCYTDSVKIIIVDPILLSTTDSGRCGPGTVVLQAQTGVNSQATWYDVPDGGTSIGTGSPFTTPYLLETDTFYVSAGNSASGGGAFGSAKVSPNNGASGYSASSLNYGIRFDATSGFTINSVDVYPSGSSAGTITLVLADNNGTVLQTAGPFSLPAGTGTTYPSATAVTLPVNFIVPSAGTGYRMYTTNLTEALIRESSGLSYPYPIAGGSYGNVIGGWANGSASATTYYYFYNWNVGTPCESPRQAVIAHVYPNPVVDLGPDVNECVDPGNLLVLDAGVQPNQPSFLWDDGSSNQVRAVDQTGNYFVTVTNQYNCKGSDTINVVLRPNPVVDLGNDTTVCEGVVLSLDAGNDGIQYFWNTGQNTEEITVSNSGSYSVLVTNAEGCTKADTINVLMQGQLPTCDGIQVLNNGGYSFSFNPLNAQNVIGYEWDFGDGSVHSYLPSPTHTYLTDGNYLVTLTLSSTCGYAQDSTAAHIVGVHDLNIGRDDLLVYPNPTHEKATISLNKDADLRMVHISLFNILGKEVYSQAADSPGKHELSLSGLASGMYTIRVQTDKGMVSRKLELIK